MKAVFMEKEGLEIKEIPIPEIKDDEILVKIKFASVCGSDIPYLNELKDRSHLIGAVMGHEGGGQVVKIGKGIKDFNVGDYVGIESHRANEEWINAGKDPYKERDSGLIGWKRMKNGILFQGTWAEYIAVPEYYAKKIPKELFFKLPGSLWEPFGNGIRIFQTIKPYLDLKKKIVISGCGYQGLQIMLILKHYYGIKKIYVTDVSQDKIEFVKQNITENAYLPWDLPKEDYDIWLEMSGSAKAIEQAFGSKISILLLFGLPAKKIELGKTDVTNFIFNHGNEMINGIHVISAFGRYKEDWDMEEEVINKISEKFDFSKIFTLLGALNNLPKLYYEGFFRNPPKGFFKVVFSEFEN